jgi:hypothetical protein
MHYVSLTDCERMARYRPDESTGQARPCRYGTHQLRFMCETLPPPPAPPIHHPLPPRPSEVRVISACTLGHVSDPDWAESNSGAGQMQAVC